ncbi:hypothetical protein [Streptomyces sp. B1I3]|uniref:hypothetical protein n=1 Tax=Streptomyces sp. B1I3 TaxID=3042264 RepID=UPI0027D77D11|nr:hypothetical protein [Streptomyces sp. B1I3]
MSRLRADLRFRAGFHLMAEYARAEQRLPPVVEDLSRALPGLIRQAQERGDLSRSRSPEVLSRLLLTLICSVYYTTAECELDAHPDEWTDIWQLVPRSSVDAVALQDEDSEATSREGSARRACEGAPLSAPE